MNTYHFFIHANTNQYIWILAHMTLEYISIPINTCNTYHTNTCHNTYHVNTYQYVPQYIPPFIPIHTENPNTYQYSHVTSLIASSLSRLSSKLPCPCLGPFQAHAWDPADQVPLCQRAGWSQPTSREFILSTCEAVPVCLIAANHPTIHRQSHSCPRHKQFLKFLGW